MMQPLLLPLPGNEVFAGHLASALEAQIAQTVFRRFPDDETYVRIETDVANRTAVIVCTLDRADAKFLPLLFAARTAREFGAARVGLVAPYLGYMRQDTRFKPGEAITSTIFAGELSRAVDWLVTVDPHLHRWHSLSAIYGVPTTAVHAAPLIGQWIAANVASPFVIGPDEESRQWVAGIAGEAPHAVLTKTRRDDTCVNIALPANIDLNGRMPVLVDDIVSSGRTVISAAKKLRGIGAQQIACVGIHAVFAGDAYAALKAAGFAAIVTTNTIPHETNALDVSALVAEAVRGLIA
jgi:ribose-phosphate pyrophosphokinase